MNQEQLSQRILDQCEYLIWVIDLDFRLIYANETYQSFMSETIGFKKIIGDSAFIKEFGKEDIEKWRAYYTRAIGGELFEIIEHFYHPELDENEYNQISFKPIYGDDNNIFAVACESREITQIVKKRYESSELINASLDVFCTIDEYGKFVHVSAASKELWGYSPEELVGKPYTDFILEEDIPKTIEIAKTIVSGQDIKTFLNRYQKKVGGIAYNSWSARWDPKVRLIYAVARDNKENIEQKEILFQSEQRFKALVQEGSDLIGILDLEGNYKYVSPTSKGVLGINPEEFEGRNIFEFIHPEDIERVREYFEKLESTSKVKIDPYRFRNHNHEWRWIETVLTNMLDNPAVEGIVANSRDITERKEAEILFQSLTDNLPGVVFQYFLYPDGRHELKYVTKGAKRVWGFSVEDAIENNQLVWDQIKAGGDIDEVLSSIVDAVSTKTKWTARWKYIMPNGEVKTHLGLGSPSFLADGTVVFNAMILDVTQEVKNEELLKEVSQIAKIGSWEVDLQYEDHYKSNMVDQIFDLEPQQALKDISEAVKFFRKDFQPLVESKYLDCVQKGIPFDFDAVVVSNDNIEKWVRVIGKPKMNNRKCVKVYGSIQDIHISKTLEIEIREILKSISDPFHVVDANWKLKYFNKEAEKLFQKTNEEVIGEVIWDVFPQKVGTPLEKIYKKVGQTRKPDSIEHLFSSNNNWYEVNVYPFQGGVSAYFRNINARKLAVEKLKAAFLEKNNILESIGDAFFTVKSDWIITYWNKKAEEFTKIPKDRAIGKNIWNVFPESIDSVFYQQYNYVLKTGEIVRFEAKDEALDRWYEVSVYPSNDGLSVYFRDIDLRKRTDQRLIVANERFEKVTEATNDAIWDWDIVNDVFYRSKAIERFFGKAASKTIREADFWKDSFHLEDKEKLRKSVEKAIADKNCSRWKEEYRLLNELGETLYVVDQGVIIRDNNGKATRMVGAMTDISERKQMEIELKALNESLQQHAFELERSNEELEQFAFITSHDMQEPLRMISSFMEQLKRKYGDQLDENALQYIHFATDGARRMKQIILDLLQYSRANRPDEEIEEVDLNEILFSFQELRRNLILENKVTIKSDNLPTLKTYRALITQIFHCLLDNAIKYSKMDETTPIEVKVVDKGNEWEFAVADKGLGIDPQFHDKIFVIFQRLHNRDEYEGTGIGLPIAKRSVEFLGGQIWLESEVDKGTTFFFTVPKNNLTKY